MCSKAGPATDSRAETVHLGEVLREISTESERLSDQCGAIQWSISTMLELVDHPDLGAEIHMLQDIDRIQQTLTDVASILKVAGAHAQGAPIKKDEIGSVIRLESLRHRLGLSDLSPSDAHAAAKSEVTWL